MFGAFSSKSAIFLNDYVRRDFSVHGFVLRAIVGARFLPILDTPSQERITKMCDSIENDWNFHENSMMAVV